MFNSNLSIQEDLSVVGSVAINDILSVGSSVICNSNLNIQEEKDQKVQ